MDKSKIANYQKKEQKEWKKFYRLTRTVFLRNDLKKELNYPVLCSNKNRSAIYRKNVEDVYKCLDVVANELVRFGKDRAGEICIDVIFSALCLMINTSYRLDYYSEDHDGWKAYKIKHHENIQAMITRFFMDNPDKRIYLTHFTELQKEIEKGNELSVVEQSSIVLIELGAVSLLQQ